MDACLYVTTGFMLSLYNNLQAGEAFLDYMKSVVTDKHQCYSTYI